MTINDLYPQLKVKTEVYGITNNPYEVKSNYIFVLTNYSKNDHLHIKQAINNGACLIISHKSHSICIPHLKVNNSKKEYIRLLKIFYHYTPIYTVGVIGNNGKTVTTELLNSIFSKLNPSAHMVENEIKYVNRCYKTKNYIDNIYPCYKIFNTHNIKNVTISIDTKSLLNNQINDIDLNGIIFTNLEYRYSVEDKHLYDYFLSNKSLFSHLKKGTLLVMNSDDLYSKFIPKYSKNKILTYGIEKGLYQAKNIKLTLSKSEFDVYYKDIYLTNINLPLFGKNNIYNALGVIAYTNELGIPLEIIKAGIESINTNNYNYSLLENKFIEELNFNNAKPCILKQTLLDLNNINKNKVISIIPTNVNLSKEELADLGTLSTLYSDITIFNCSNNLSSIYDLISNITTHNYYICTDINQAYKLAYKLFNDNDVILSIN